MNVHNRKYSILQVSDPITVSLNVFFSVGKIKVHFSGSHKSEATPMPMGTSIPNDSVSQGLQTIHPTIREEPLPHHTIPDPFSLLKLAWRRCLYFRNIFIDHLGISHQNTHKLRKDKSSTKIANLRFINEPGKKAISALIRAFAWMIWNHNQYFFVVSKSLIVQIQSIANSTKCSYKVESLVVIPSISAACASTTFITWSAFS